MNCPYNLVGADTIRPQCNIKSKKETNKLKNHTTTHTADDLLIKYVYIILLFQRKNEYSYTVGEGLRALPQTTKTWEYNDSTWSDLLTNFNGESITYDEIGNPLTIGSKSLTWTGRQLQSITDGDSEIAYTYNGDGLRTSKEDYNKS